jgi:hypothetical protein
VVTSLAKLCPHFPVVVMMEKLRCLWHMLYVNCIRACLCYCYVSYDANIVWSVHQTRVNRDASTPRNRVLL